MFDLDELPDQIDEVLEALRARCRDDKIEIIVIDTLMSCAALESGFSITMGDQGGERIYR